jgi:hypothetical protein
MNAELTRLVAAGGYYTAATASSNNKGLSNQFPVVFAFYRNEEGVQIQVYDVSLHDAN